LGHADTSDVERIYGHLAPTDMSATIRKLAPKLNIFSAAYSCPTSTTNSNLLVIPVVIGGSCEHQASKLR
jgi:hypothetical protein